QDGTKQAETEHSDNDRKLAAMTEKFAKSISPLLTDYRDTITQMQQDMPRVALAIAKKVAGAALNDNAGAVVEDIALRCVETMMADPKLTIPFHTSLVSRLERRVQQLADHLKPPTDIHVIGDEAIPVTDCRVSWKHGALARHTGELWQEIDKVV